MEQTESHLYKIRHSLAHVLAQAVLQIRPNAKLAFGPPIDTGCYYDFDLDEPLSDKDFKDITKRIRKIIGQKQEFTHEEKSTDEAIAYLESEGESFKVEYCKELAQGGESTIGFYTNGPFTDMCAGPHLEHTGEIPKDCFKIDTLAGAYWRGDEKNPQLTRIYVLAFETKEELKSYIDRRELAKQRDHRKLGKELELFTFSDQVGPGLPLWMPNGTVLCDELENLAKEKEARAGYQRVATPHIAKEDLYITSGHLPYYADGMYPPMDLEGESRYYMKAMNCPHHHMIYGTRKRSYRELPLKYAEYGSCYRYEHSGSLAGLLRVRSISMNDAHIYCTLEQLKEQLIETFQMTIDYYSLFRFDGIQVRISTNDESKKDKFVDNPELWEFSKNVLMEVVGELDVQHVMGPGEAAFYGPKIDFQAKTLLGREETLGTTQLDFAQPISFDLKYIGEDGADHRPYIVHRAPLSSHERFVAFLIEHFGGAFPTWLAPTQVIVIPVSSECLEYAHSLKKELHQELARVEVDESDNSFNKKIREAVTRKIPNMLIVGDKEVQSHAVTLRRYCVKEQLTLPFEQFKKRLTKLRSERVMDNFPDVEVQV